MLENFASRLQKATATHENLIPLLIAVVLLGATALRALADEIVYSLHVKTWGMFVLPDDLFGDLIEAITSYQFLTLPLLTSGRYLSWNGLFQYYLRMNHYHHQPLTNLHMPPFPTLIYLAATRLLIATNPNVVILAFFAIYGVGAALVARFLKIAMATSSALAYLCFFILIMSYPALFLLLRGNISASLTAVALLAYLVSAISGRARWMGWLCLALAVNFRPNVAIFVLVELVRATNIKDVLLHAIYPGVMSIVILVCSYLLASNFYPAYTIPAILHNLALYNAYYVVQGWGDQFNISLYAALKNARHFLHLQPYFSPTVTMAVTSFGGVILAGTLLLAVQRKLSVIELTFLAASINTLFTPVFGLYHLLSFAGVLLLGVAEALKAPAFLRDRHIPIIVISILVMCPLGGQYSDGAVCALLLLCGIALIMHKAVRRPWLPFSVLPA